MVVVITESITSFMWKLFVFFFLIFQKPEPGIFVAGLKEIFIGSMRGNKLFSLAERIDWEKVREDKNV